MSARRVAISKTMSHALRHQPWLYELELDDEGWVPLEALLEALELERADVVAVIEAADKQRFELDGERIRARYGHSVPGKLAKRRAEPPAMLYHGTSPSAAEVIAANGLQPMGRQYVHLSVDVETAMLVGGRKARAPVLLGVRAAEAFAAGVRFYEGNESVWLADEVPARFITGRDT